VRWRRMRFLARDPEDVASPGVQLKVYEDIAAVPRPGDRVYLDGRKFAVVEGGVMWSFPHEGVLVTVALEYLGEG
jgi:hypothetical protein